MKRRRPSPRIPAIRATVLKALQHSLSASRLSIAAQTHAGAQKEESFRSMAEATDQMIDALDSLHETLQSLLLALEPRDIDLSRNRMDIHELAWPIGGSRRMEKADRAR